MKFLIPPALAVVAVLWFVNTADYQHATHHKQMTGVIVLAVIVLAVTTVAASLVSRRARPAATARR